MRERVGRPAGWICVRLFALAAAWLPAALPPAQAAPAPDFLVGAPETGSTGIVETIEEIAARDRSSFETSPPDSSPRFEFDPIKQVNGSARTGSRWPVASAAEFGAIDSGLLPQTAGVSFRTIGLPESGFVPPDTAGDVGPTQIVVHVNGRIRVFGKTGVPGSLNVTALSFWSSVANGSQPIFPQVRYDRLSGRWILTAVNSTKPNNRIMIAVQTTPGTIAASSSFTFYQFNQASGGGSGDTTNFCDSPTLGIDGNALYIGCNMYSTSGALNRITVYVVRKSSLIPAPGTLVVTAFRDISNGFAGPGPFTPVGVDNDDAQAAAGYFVGVDIGTLGLLQLRRVGTPGGTPTLSGNLPLTVLATAPPISQPASGSSVGIDAGDDRLSRASIRKNKITGAATLFTSQAGEVDDSCASAAGGGRNGARWYEIAGSAPTPSDALSGNPTLVQSGTLCDGSPTNPKGYVYPSVAATGQGHMALGSSFAAANLFAGVAAAGRTRFAAAGTTEGATTLQNGLASYTFVAGGRNRWGDYSFTGVDPTDDQTIWTFQEYADSTANNWAVRAVQLKAPPPPVLTGVQATVCLGVPATVVTLTGTIDAPVAGAEFFDPGPDTGGPGFSSRLTATATGGLAVNGTPGIVLPASPSTQPVLQVTLSLDTTAAGAGLKNVTIRNPDGQSTTGIGVIRVDQPLGPVASNNGPVCAGGTLELSVTAVPNATYAWTGPNGFTSSVQNPTIPNATAAAAGTYSVSITNTGCTFVPATTAVTVIADTSSCEDGNACTTGDVCGGGMCQPGAAVPCNDGNACTADSCAPASGCVYVDTTPVACNDANACTDDACHPVSGCFHTNNVAPCDDGNACTAGDACAAASCRPGAAVVCNDNNACTSDACNPASGCVFTDTSASCDDANACTADSCLAASGCLHTDIAAACDDANPCTDDVCVPASGCAHTNNAASCDDGNGCTEGDRCAGGGCAPGAAVVCNDANACTIDSCNPLSGCAFTDNTAACDDHNPCTDDTCGPATGCAHAANTRSCDDGNACTAGDACGDGVCRPGAAVVCNDQDACTNDSCNAILGCVFADNTAACNDNNACTDDSCDAATGCINSNNVKLCSDGNACTEGDRCGGGSCHPGTPQLCDDFEICTDDSCNPASGCVFAANALACDDGSACTTGDRCGGGACQPGAPLLCDDGNVCTVNGCNAVLGCIYTDTTEVLCDDGNVCTDDSCDPVTGCFHPANTNACTDGNACTTGETCSGGACGSGVAVVCNDGNVCTADSCNPASGCVFTDATAACDDNNACTADSCHPVSGCAHADVTTACNDGNVCTDDSCEPSSGCVHASNAASCNDGNACTTADVCAAGVCLGGAAVLCDDGVYCTTDSCNPATGLCVYASNANVCDDLNACTTGDRCTGGACQGIEVVCDDGSVCTTDACDPASGCIFTAITAACNDGDVCTTDGCHPVTGCFHTYNTAPCDDGILCTNADTCSGGTCAGVAGPPVEIRGLLASGRTTTTFNWTGLPGGPGYDVAGSTLADLRAGGSTGASCLANDLTGASYIDAQPNPASGQGYYYLIRAQNVCGTGTYGFNSAGAERTPVAACP